MAVVNALSFRDGVLEDVPKIEALLKGAGLPPVQVQEHIEGFLVREQGGNVVACGGIEVYGTAALVRSVVVAPAAQGNGVGRDLVSQLEAKALRSGVTSLCLFTVGPWQFWERLGYRDGTLAEWPEPARACWPYRYVSEHEERFHQMAIHPIYKTLGAQAEQQ